MTAEGLPPSELFDASAAVWHDQKLYRAFITAHAFDEQLPVTERMGLETHPGNRRNYAAAAWGEANGVVTQPGHADWNRLREMGLIG